jgi:hypothetical protein
VLLTGYEYSLSLVDSSDSDQPVLSGNSGDYNTTDNERELQMGRFAFAQSYDQPHITKSATEQFIYSMFVH